MLAVVGLAGCVCGCNQADPTLPEERPFQFATVLDDALDVRVASPQGPLRGVTLVLREVPTIGAQAGDEVPLGDVIWNGTTGLDGHVRDRLTRQAATTQLLLFAHAPGYAGPYDDENTRTKAGAYAPAAWVTVPASDLGDYTLHLAPKAVTR